MSFASTLHKVAGVVDPISRLDGGKLDLGYDLLAPKSPPTPPGVPNPNDALNASQSTADALRMRRGLMANIYAGAGNAPPVSGKTQLGT